MGDGIKWTEALVFETLQKVFPSGAFTLLSGVRNGTGYARKTVRTADAVVVSNWPSRGLYLAGVEIKVSLQDWRRELACPDKADGVGKFCRYWYAAAPVGVIPLGEVPETWGLIECSARAAKIVKPALANEAVVAPDILMVAAIMRTLADSTVPKDQVDARIRKAAEEREAAVRKSMQFEIERITGKLTEFEAAAGVSIDRWNAGKIGEAVRMVLDGEHLQAKRQMQYIVDAATRILALAKGIQE